MVSDYCVTLGHLGWLSVLGKHVGRWTENLTSYYSKQKRIPRSTQDSYHFGLAEIKAEEVSWFLEIGQPEEASPPPPTRTQPTVLGVTASRVCI